MADRESKRKIASNFIVTCLPFKWHTPALWQSSTKRNHKSMHKFLETACHSWKD